MARTIAEIKQEMTTEWMADATVRERYGLAATDTFEGKFSKVSIEGLLFYVVAFGIWVLEKLMDDHKAEVQEMLDDRTPHTVRWYRNKVLEFQPDWADEPPVKYCSIDDRGCRLKVKVAGGEAGARAPISSAAAEALASYLAEEKDAGLKIEIINERKNALKASLTVWYDPMKLVPMDTPVETALKAYISNLDFDGLLSRNGIVDALREVEGVQMVRIDALHTKYGQGVWRVYGEQERATSGYWTLADADIAVLYSPYRRETL